MKCLTTTALVLLTAAGSALGGEIGTPPQTVPETPQPYRNPSGTVTQTPPSNRMLTSGNRVLSTGAIRQGMRVLPQNAYGHGQTLTVCGSLLDQDKPGIYAYDIQKNTFEPLAISTDLFANANGMIYDNTYYSFKLEYDFSGEVCWVNVYLYDPTTWEKTDSKVVYYQNSPIDLDVDPITNRIYGCFPADDNYGTSNYVWAQFNPKSYTRASICELDVKLVAVAADKTGQFYAVDEQGDFYKVDKQTGEKSKIGPTGLDVTSEAQSMTYDSVYGDMYLSAELESHETGLYTIDLDTGRATLVNMYPGQKPFMGIFVPAPEADFNAPDVPTDLNARFDEGSLSGTVSFTMPAQTYGRQPLSGTLGYVLEMDGTEYRRGSAEAGSKVSVDVETGAGNHTFRIYATNAYGQSLATEATAYAGPDTLKAVGDLKAEKSADGVEISWTAPTETQNGGWFDPANVTYTVTRTQDGKTIAQGLKATSCRDAVGGEPMRAYTYSVTPYHGDLAGEPAMTDAVAVGSYCTMPWKDDFNDSATWVMYTVHNLKEGTRTWEYDEGRQSATVDYDRKDPKDDWLMTPGLKMSANRTYKLEFMTRTKRALPETIEVKMGTGTAVEDMTTTVMEPLTIESDNYDITDIDRVHEFYLTVPADGVYHFGFHGMTPEAYHQRIEIHYITVTEAAMPTAPTAPADLTATPGENGALEAYVSFKAPAMAVNETTLTTLEKAEIWVNGELAKTFDKPAPGSTLTATVPTVQGDNSFMAKAYNENGQGLEAKTTAYTGVTVPAVVSELNAKLTDHGVLLSWKAPQKGENGGYVNPDELTYTIVRNDHAVVGYEVQGTEFTDDLNGFAVEGQRIVSYQVFASNVAGMGYGYGSNGIVLGEGFHTLPYAESFPNGFMTNSPWGIASTTETSWWTTTDGSAVSSYDNDNGQAYFLPKGENENSIIYTGRFNLNRTDNPTISLWYYNDGVSSNKVEVCWTDNFADFHPLGVITFNTEAATETWLQFKASLKELADKPFVAFGLRGVAQGEEWKHGQYIDLIEIKDDLEYNLEMREFDAPGAITFGHEGNFAGYVTNRGSRPADGYSIDLLCNGEKVATSQGPAISVGESATYTMKFTPSYELAPSARFQAVINWTQDQNSKDNASEERTVLITTNEFPAVTDLAGERDTDDNVTLTWSAPAPGTTPQRTVEDFEDYTSYIIEDIGPWTLYDIDGECGTYGIIYGGKVVDFMNASYPHAWMVWNPAKCGMSQDKIGIDALMPHSGEQFLASFQDTDDESDDWLVSPELSGEEQTVTFWVRTPIPNNGMETFEVYYSTTDRQIESFTKIEGLKEEAFINWEEVAATLPAGARYFAIRHTSKGSKFLMGVDDITYIAKDAPQEDLVVSGYTVYRDDKKLATVGADQRTFSDTKAAGSRHSYAVTVNYEQGESGYSNIVNSETSGLEQIASGVAVYGLKGEIAVRNAAGLSVSVIAADGKRCAELTAASDCETIPVQTGVYLVKAGGTTFKVAVR